MEYHMSIWGWIWLAKSWTELNLKYVPMDTETRAQFTAVWNDLCMAEKEQDLVLAVAAVNRAMELYH